jgi:hypothetical protein
VNNANESDGADPKKSYRSPELRVYGDLVAITQAVGKTGAKDAGGMPPNSDKTAA